MLRNAIILATLAGADAAATARGVGVGLLELYDPVSVEPTRAALFYPTAQIRHR